MSSGNNTRKRRCRALRPDPPHDRIVLLFDLDCFYAQCERVRLGLPLETPICLLQWDSVLAVSYPARAFGIQRGDSWQQVHDKSNGGDCWAIHLAILEKEKQAKKLGNDHENHPGMDDDDQGKNKDAQQSEEHEQDDEDGHGVVLSVEDAFNDIYKLSREDQLEAQKERGIQRFNQEGKACLERYRIASMRIFAVVMESLIQRLGQGNFVLERASIDEFYLDISDYCYRNNQNDEFNGTTGDGRCHQEQETPPDENHPTGMQVATEERPPSDASVTIEHDTKVVGMNVVTTADTTARIPPTDNIQDALDRACLVSHWIRTDVWETLGFTMSAGVSTNKMMAKLTASFGKPNGQAVLHPEGFATLLNETKITKVRHFGGKLGRKVRQELFHDENDPEAADHHTMGDLSKISLSIMERSFSREKAKFVFDASRGIDQEDVRETTGALVKSITAYKSFPATNNKEEIRKWLDVLATEIVTRVAKDSARNKRYPKTCTLNFSFYTTENGQKPRPNNKSTRGRFQSKAMRLIFPPERHPSLAAKGEDLVHQAMKKLSPILVGTRLRGVGIATSNFELRGQPPEGLAAIESYFGKKQSESSSTQRTSGRADTNSNQQHDRSSVVGTKGSPRRGTDPFYDTEQDRPPRDATNEESSLRDAYPAIRSLDKTGMSQQDIVAIENALREDATTKSTPHVARVDPDLAMAKKLQASFDRENYVLSRAVPSRRKNPPKKKHKTIRTFFGKK